MQILEYGNPEQKKIILIHGFESPYQIWNDYIEHYKEKYCVIVPILPGHNVNEKEDFVSFHKCVEELENYLSIPNITVIKQTILKIIEKNIKNSKVYSKLLEYTEFTP